MPPLPKGIEGNIGSRLRKFRNLKGKTQKELADQIGISRGALESYEAGRNHLSDEMLIRFSVALKVSLDELVGLAKTVSENERAPNVKLVKRMQRIQSLATTDQKAIIRTIDTFLKGAEKAKSFA